jgi:hypothetical protein
MNSDDFSRRIDKYKEIEDIESILKKLDYVDEEKLFIKEPVIAFLILRHKKTNTLSTLPLSVSWDDVVCNDDSALEEDEEVIKTLAAPSGSFKILGIFPNGENYPEKGRFISIGYEFKGGNIPDWKEVLKDRIRSEYKIANLHK